MSMDKCKVCGGDLNLSDSFCPQCGFEHHILPEPVSNEVRMYEEKRINACKKVWEEHCQDIKKLHDEKDSEKKTLEQKLKKIKEETQSAQKEKEQEKKKYEANLKDANKQISELLHEILGLNEVVDALRAENTELNANKSNLLDLKGIVLISDITRLSCSDMLADACTPINRQCLPVLSGINTYGTANSGGHHYQITIKHRGDVFLPKHFAVYTNHSKGLVIKDLSNGRITLNGNPFIEEYAGNSKFIIKQDRQMFTVEIKMFNL